MIESLTAQSSAMRPHSRRLSAYRFRPTRRTERVDKLLEEAVKGLPPPEVVTSCVLVTLSLGSGVPPVAATAHETAAMGFGTARTSGQAQRSAISVDCLLAGWFKGSLS